VFTLLLFKREGRDVAVIKAGGDVTSGELATKESEEARELN
jgi:hypothetical protein